MISFIFAVVTTIVTLSSSAVQVGQPTLASTPRAAIVVHVTDFAFSPTRVELSAGDTVTFVNDVDEAHAVTADDKSFDSGSLDKQAKWAHRFMKTGTVAYHCSIHPSMQATVIVTAAVSK